MGTTAIFLDGPDTEDGVHYPSSDGKPMAETDFHVLAIRLLLDALDDVFAAREDVYVAGNVNWFWEQGTPRSRRAPDVMVVFGVEKGPRRSFRSWREGGAVPAACFEMASARTWRTNLGPVREDYEANGVREYFIFDPTRDYLEAPLVGFRRRGRRFQRIRPDEAGAMASHELGLCLVPEGGMIRLVHIETGERVLTREEQSAVSRAEAAASRAHAELLAAEVARLKAQLKATNKSANGAD
jgi:Uma2 family endonuclease